MKNRMLLIAAVAILVAAPAMAFHHGGVAYCSGCHTMHNSEGGQPMKFTADGTATLGPVGEGYPDLLLFPNPTDTCLRCHGGNTASYNVFESDPTAPTLSEYYSAGNFTFILEDNLNDGRGGAILGEKAGHNLRSGIKGSNWDTTLSAPPGGAAELGNNNIECSSCHDPHGQNSFRLLYQQGQSVDVAGDSVTFAGTMVATGISYSGVETPTNHNAYASGYSEWCSTCHGDFHGGQAQASPFIHPSGATLPQAIVDKYNAYRGTANCVNFPGAPCGTGTAVDAYLPDVPFEDPSVTTTSTAGPTTASRVACVTCHRAHATSAQNAGRWDFNIQNLADDGVTSGSWAIPYSNLVNMPADDDQKSLCNKCHTQDEYDELETP